MNRFDRQTTTCFWGRLVLVMPPVLLTLLWRLPACGESLWLDELHSAWTVSGGLGEVAWRAAAGNQTGAYFYLLWFWSAAFGTGEVALRSISVLASAITTALLVLGVRWRTGNSAAAWVAGGLFALEPHAVFFGTELRPYAWVMTCAAAAAICCTRWLGSGTRSGGAPERVAERDASGFWRTAMLGCVCLAALLHPTSLGVLGWLVVLGGWSAWTTGRLRLGRADVVGVAIVAATLVRLASSSLPRSWEHRDWWRAFGVADRWIQLWQAWDFLTLLLLPLGTAVAAVLIQRGVRLAMVMSFSEQESTRVGHGPNPARLHRSQSDSQREAAPVGRAEQGRGAWWVGMIPGAAGVLGTLAFFVASYLDWVPLWHRRYFVAALPLLVWTAGEWAAFAAATLADPVSRLTRAVPRLPARRGDSGGPAVVGSPTPGRDGSRGWFPEKSRPRMLDAPGWATSWVIALLLIGFQLWHQGTWQALASGQIPRRLRGEVWREAVRLVRQQRSPGEVVWLDSGLIEAGRLSEPLGGPDGLAAWQQEYLGFPLRGPYRLDAAVAVSPVEHRSRLRKHLSELPARPTSVWLITRSGRGAAEALTKRIESIEPVTATLVRGGRPSVIRLSLGR